MPDEREFPQCRKCNLGTLVPLSDYGRDGAPIVELSDEFKLLDCEFCDDVIDLSDLELPELEPAPV